MSQQRCCVQWGIFLFFGIFTVAGTLFVYFLFPETKGIPIEEVPNVFKRHWYWRRFVVDMPGGESSKALGAGIELARTSAGNTETPIWVQHEGESVSQGLVSIWEPKSDDVVHNNGGRGLMDGHENSTSPSYLHNGHR